MSQPQQDHRDRHHRLVVDPALLVAGGDAAVLLEAVDAPFHLIAQLVRGLVEARVASLVGLCRDHHADPTTAQLGAHAGIAVALVASQPVGVAAGAAPPRPPVLAGAVGPRVRAAARPPRGPPPWAPPSRCPPVTLRVSGLPPPSTRRCSLVDQPPRERPSASSGWCTIPFFVRFARLVAGAGGVLVGADHAAV